MPVNSGRREPETYDLAQRRHRRSSLGVFVLLVLFYVLSFEILWMAVRWPLLGWLGRLWSARLPSAGELLGVAVAALLAALVHWTGAVVGGPDRIVRALGAAPPDTRDRRHRLLTDVLRELELAVGSAPVRLVVVPSAAINAFTVTDLRGGPTLGVTEGAVSRLSRAQLQAVLAHELAHVIEGDDRLVTVACSLFGVFTQMIEGVNQAAEQDGRLMILQPLVWLLTLGAYLLNVLVSRRREYLADAGAVALTRDPVALAEALWKAGRHGGEGAFAQELAPLFMVSPSSGSIEEADGWWANLFATHPPLRRRIRALLNLAHVGFTSLSARLEAEEETRPASSSTGEEEGESWMAYRDGSWQGPFTAGRMAAEGWLNPRTWLARPGSAEVRPASAFPALLALLATGAAPGGGPACPLCRVPLLEREYEGILVRQCSGCRGVLVEQGQERRILTREEERFAPRLLRKAREFKERHPVRPRAGDTEGPLPALYRCPGCGHPMSRSLYSYQYFVEVDRCHGCRLVWFDGDELEVLQILVEEARNGPSPGLGDQRAT